LREFLVTVGHHAIGVAAVEFNQAQPGGAVKEILFKRVIAKQFDQDFSQTAPKAGDSDVAFIIYFMEFSKHQVVVAEQPILDNFIQFAKRTDHPGIFLVGLIVVVAFHYTELRHRLGVDIAGEKSKPPCGTKETVLVLTSRFANDTQRLSSMLLGNVVIRDQPFFDDSSTVATGVGELFSVNFKKEAKRLLVNIHGDIDNIIELDFVGSTRNLHLGFSLLCVDSTGYEPAYSYCTSDMEGEAFLLAA
jgi:hypothetical protein